MFKPADNYLKLTVRTERTMRDYIRPFHSADESELTDALADLLGVRLNLQRTMTHATFAFSAYDAAPFKDEEIAQIGAWALEDLQPALAS